MTVSLDELRGYRENDFTLSNLADQVRRGAGVIPFVGAGLSAGLGFPLWRAFLEKQAALASQELTIREILDAGDYERGAMHLLTSRHRRRFDDAIKDAYGNRRLPAKISGPLSHLPLLPSGPVVTTNFDRALEAAFKQSGRAFEDTLWGARIARAVTEMNADRRVLIKLHGDWEDPDDRVLTEQEYDLAYGVSTATTLDATRPLPRLVRLLFLHRPLLFVGCSLLLDRTILLLRALTAENPEIAHYAIVERPIDDEGIAERDAMLSSCAIRPIWYPRGVHGYVDAVLSHLLPEHVPRVNERSPSDGRDKGATIRARSVADARLSAATVRRCCEAAGIASEVLSVVKTIVSNDRSTVQRWRANETELIFKWTRSDLVQMSSLRRVVGREYATSQESMTLQIAPPIFVDEIADGVIEIVPYLNGVTLDSVINRSNYRIWGDFLGQVFNCLIRASRWMHQLGLIYRDIHPSNIMVTAIGPGNRLTLSLLDFSFCCRADEPPPSPVANGLFTAPEQLANAPVPESDWYSVAATCYYLTNGRPPLADDVEAFRAGLNAIDVGLYRPSPDFDGGDEQLVDDPWRAPGLIESLLRRDPEMRPRDIGRVLLIGSSRAIFDRPLTGVLDLGDVGVIATDSAGEWLAARPDKAASLLRRAVNDGVSLNPELQKKM